MTDSKPTTLADLYEHFPAYKDLSWNFMLLNFKDKSGENSGATETLNKISRLKNMLDFFFEHHSEAVPDIPDMLKGELFTSSMVYEQCQEVRADLDLVIQEMENAREKLNSPEKTIQKLTTLRDIIDGLPSKDRITLGGLHRYMQENPKFLGDMVAAFTSVGSSVGSEGNKECTQILNQVDSLKTTLEMFFDDSDDKETFYEGELISKPRIIKVSQDIYKRITPMLEMEKLKADESLSGAMQEIGKLHEVLESFLKTERKLDSQIPYKGK